MAKKGENFLDYTPAISPRHTWSEEDGKVTIHMEHRGLYPWIAQKFFKRPRISHIALDEMGSFIYPLIDGERTVEQLAQLVMIGVFKQALSMEEIACVLSELCAQDVETGYARFCAEATGEDVAGDEGCAVSAAILAAVQVMRARSLIAAMENSHE